MKRLALLVLISGVLCSRAASAQLIMQMSNGWSFSFAGNVNAFGVYTNQNNNGPSNFSIRTGLLPGFANFEAKGKEAGMDLRVHFGFAPQINNAAVHDNFGNGTQAGAQIDMREVYLTVGSSWGQMLVGRELALFGRQNILQDQTLFGVGAVGIGGGQGGGTTLGRIGYGYIYPNFQAQATYTTKTGVPAQLAVGIFQPSIVGAPGAASTFAFTPLPRLEAEFTYNMKSGSRKWLLWAGGLVQTASHAATNGQSLTSTGFTAGVRGDISSLSVVVSGYLGSGVGTLLMFSGVAGGPIAANDSTARPSDGGYIQVGYTLGNKKTTIAGSYGLSRLKNASSGETAASGGNSALRSQLSSYTGGIYHQWTKSVKLVGEVTQEHQQGVATPSASQLDISAGILLFF